MNTEEFIKYYQEIALSDNKELRKRAIAFLELIGEEIDIYQNPANRKEFYYDKEGNRVTLEKKCRTNPIWAANEIRRLRINEETSKKEIRKKNISTI